MLRRPAVRGARRPSRRAWSSPGTRSPAPPSGRQRAHRQGRPVPRRRPRSQGIKVHVAFEHARGEPVNCVDQRGPRRVAVQAAVGRRVQGRDHEVPDRAARASSPSPRGTSPTTTRSRPTTTRSAPASSPRPPTRSARQLGTVLGRGDGHPRLRRATRPAPKNLEVQRARSASSRSCARPTARRRRVAASTTTPTSTASARRHQGAREGDEVQVDLARPRPAASTSSRRSGQGRRARQYSCKSARQLPGRGDEVPLRQDRQGGSATSTASTSTTSTPATTAVRRRHRRGRRRHGPASKKRPAYDDRQEARLGICEGQDRRGRGPAPASPARRPRRAACGGAGRRLWRSASATEPLAVWCSWPLGVA